MANGIRTGDPRGFNKGRSLKFLEDFRVRQTPEEGQRTYRPKRCGNNNKDEDNSPETLNEKKSDEPQNEDKRKQKDIQTLGLKKQWNMRVTVIPIVVGALGMIPKGLDMEIRKSIETVQSTVLLRSTRILRSVLETWGDLLSLRLQRKTTS